MVRVAVTSLYWSDRCTVFDRLTKPREVSIVYRIPHGQKRKEKFAKSYMKKGFLIYEEMRNYLVIYI
jgi:hypothetical protein